MTTNNRQKYFLLIAGLLVAFLVGDQILFTRLWKAWQLRADRIATLTKAIRNSEAVLQREKLMAQRWAQMKRGALPANASVAEAMALKAVDRWAQDSRLSLTSIKPQWKSGAEDYVTLECQADGLGGIQTVNRFLYELEQDPLALKVEELTIASRDNEGQQLSLAVRFSGLLLQTDKK